MPQYNQVFSMEDCLDHRIQKQTTGPKTHKTQVEKPQVIKSDPTQTKPQSAETKIEIKQPKKSIILSFSGSFCPVHSGHIDVLVAAKEEMEKRGYNVHIAYLAPSSDSYVGQKLGKWAISLAQRVKLCELASEEHKWIRVCSYGTASSQKLAEQLFIDHGRTMQVYEIGGADYINKVKIGPSRKIIGIERVGSDKITKKAVIVASKKVAEISSTKIRECLDSPDEKDWQNLATLKWIHPNVLKYMIDHFESDLFL